VERVTAEGDVVHVVEYRASPAHSHGWAPVVAAYHARGEQFGTLALDAATFASVDARRMLLLDTETTGLAGGTGTLPFLIGVAAYEPSSAALEVDQYFLQRPGEEAPMLRALSARVAASSCLVTFNGKSFDWPLLRARYVMNRLPPPPERPHLDVLHCARRVLKRRGAGMRLAWAEREVLGFTRDGDIPGSEIPALYFAYLKHGDASRLMPVFEHNKHDL
jgi:uncharacterized protein YprB with RNaseH-like and TPR domain